MSVPLVQDLRFGTRTLLRERAFTMVALLTLTLGIGATTAIFSVMDAVLLRPLPYRDPRQLVAIHEDRSPSGFPRASVAPRTYFDLRAQTGVFEDVAAVNETSYNLSSSTGEAQLLNGILVTHNLFPLLGAKPLLGRVFFPEEDRPGSDHEILLSYRLWHSRFAGDPRIVGQQVRLNDEPYMIVGVMPSGFSFPKETDPIDVWAPKVFLPSDLVSHLGRYLTVVGRLRSGVTSSEANAALQPLANDAIRQYPREMEGESGYIVEPLQESYTREARSGLVMLMIAVGLILLIACANLANLLLSRASAREREFAVRGALGASRGRIVGQVLTESALLAMGGALLGVCFALGSFLLLKHLIPQELSSTITLKLNLPVLLFASAVGLGSSLLFGIVPALESARIDLNRSLKEGARGSTGARGNRLGQVFVVGEIALSLMLLAGAGLLLKSFWKLRHVDPGFQADYVLTADFDLAETRYRNWDVQTRFVQRVLDGVRSLPEVESVGLTSVLPLTWKGGTGEFVPEASDGGPNSRFSTNQRVITPGYFEAMKTGLIRGRFFDERDQENAPKVAIVNQAMAHTIWPGQNAIGKRFRAEESNNAGPWFEVVGIVGDVKQMGLSQAPRQEVYFPYLQAKGNYMWPHSFAIRTRAEPLSVAKAVRRVVASVDPSEPIFHVITMGDIVDRETSQSRMQTILLGALAALALIMACVGIYGVMAYMVSQRTGEMGIRMALGARRRDVVLMVLWRGMALTLTGVAIGVAGALASAKFMRSLLFEVNPADPTIVAGVSFLLIAVALAACVNPARKAASVDPLQALRAE